MDIRHYWGIKLLFNYQRGKIMKKLFYFIPALLIAGMFFYGCQEEPNVIEPGSSSLNKLVDGFDIVLIDGGPVDNGNDTYTWTWSIIQTDAAPNALSHWNFLPGLCLIEADIESAAYRYGSEGDFTSIVLTSPYFKTDPSMDCEDGNLVFKFDFGTEDLEQQDVTTYYQLVINKNYEVNPDAIAYWKASNACGQGTFDGIGCDTPPPPEPECETAYAFGGDQEDCFINHDFGNWGWSNGPLEPDTYTYDIYAGAGQCDINKGELVGTLTVVYDGITATVTYDMFAGFTMDEVHLYVGNAQFPLDNKGNPTVAPGKYPVGEEFDEPQITFTESFDVSGPIYVIAHAVVCAGIPCDEWIIYGSNLNAGNDPLDDAIYAYDLNAQTQTLVYDPTPIDGNKNYPNANAYDPDNKRIYFGTDDGRLFYHQIGSVTHVQVEGGATSGSFGTMHNASWYNGKLYYIPGNGPTLYEVSIVGDVATRTVKGTVPRTGGYGDIAFDPANPGRFIGSCSAGWYWFDINGGSGTLTHNGDGDASLRQLAYGSDGVLYAVKATTGDFYTVVYDIGAGTVTHTFYWASPYTFTDLASGPQCP